MGTFLKAYLKKTNDPVEMFFDYTDSILKADTESFLTALTDDDFLQLSDETKKAIEELKEMMSEEKQEQYKKITNKYNENRKKISGLPKRKTRLTFEEKQEQKEIKQKLKELEKKYKEDIKDNKLHFASLGIGETEPSKGVDTSWLTSVQVYIDDKTKKPHTHKKPSKKENISAMETSTGWEAFPARKKGGVGVRGNNRQVNVEEFIKILKDIKKEIPEDTKLITQLITGFEDIKDQLLGKGDYDTTQLKETGRTLAGYEQDAEKAGQGHLVARKDKSKKVYEILKTLKKQLDQFYQDTDGEGTYLYAEKLENPLRKLKLDRDNDALNDLREIAKDSGIPINLSVKTNQQKYEKEIEDYLRGQWYAKLIEDFNDLEVENFSQYKNLKELHDLQSGMVELGLPEMDEKKEIQLIYDKSDKAKFRELEKEYQEIVPFSRIDIKQKETVGPKKGEQKQFWKKWSDALSENYPDGKPVKIVGEKKVPLYYSYVTDREKEFEKWAKEQPKVHLQIDRKTKRIFISNKQDVDIISNRVKMHNILNDEVKFVTFDGKEKGTFLEAIEWATAHMKNVDKLWEKKDLDIASKFFPDIVTTVTEKFGKKYTFAFNFKKGQEDSVETVKKKEWEEFLGNPPIQLFDVDIQVLKKKRLAGKKGTTIGDLIEGLPSVREETEFVSETGIIIIKFTAAHGEEFIDKKIKDFINKFDLNKFDEKDKPEQEDRKGYGKRKEVGADYAGVKQELKDKLKREPTEDEIRERMVEYQEKRIKFAEQQPQRKWDKLSREEQLKEKKKNPNDWKGFKTKPKKRKTKLDKDSEEARKLEEQAKRGKPVWLHEGKRQWKDWGEKGKLIGGGSKKITIDANKIQVKEHKHKPIVDYKTVDSKGKPSYIKITVNALDLNAYWVKEEGQKYEFNEKILEEYPDDALPLEYDIKLLIVDKNKAIDEIHKIKEYDREDKPKKRRVIRGKGVKMFSADKTWVAPSAKYMPYTEDWSWGEWKDWGKKASRPSPTPILEAKVTASEWKKLIDKKITEKKIELNEIVKKFEKKLPKIKQQFKKVVYERRGEPKELRQKGGYRMKNPTEVKKTKTKKISDSWREILKVSK